MTKAPKAPTVKVVKYMFSLACKKRPDLFIAYGLYLVERVIRKFQMIIIPKFLIDELVAIYNGEDITVHIQKAISIAFLAVGLPFIASIIQSIASRIQGLCDEWFNEYFQVEVNDLAMAIDFQLTEDPAALDQLNKAKEGMSWYSGNVCGILNQFFDIINNVIVFIGVIAVICLSSPFIIPIEVVSLVLTAIFNKKIREIELKSFQKLSKSNRIFGYLFFQISDFHYGKDIRLYNSSHLFNKKSSEHLDNQIAAWTEQAEGSRKQQYCMNVVSAAENFATYFYIGYRALKHIITIGDFSMCLSAASTFTECCNNTVRDMQEIIKRVNYANEFLKFKDFPIAISKGTKPVEARTDHIIEFKDVSFKYPRGDKYILKHVNITIPAGQHLAVVGLNGAGKTTFIKLLCRLYDVTDGEILVDGTNIKEYTEDEYRKLFGVLFQDFKIFAFSVRENISFDPDTPDERIDEVLKLAGLYDDVQKMPNKNNTNLSKSFDKKGTDFSGGQKQKTAIARTLFKNAPIVILDEPTAALDPIAEAEIYEDFNKMVGGKTAIYISHRLSSCKFCDKIAVFDEGVLKEYGTHEELMKMEGGVYNQMFTTQAKQYID